VGGIGRGRVAGPVSAAEAPVADASTSKADATLENLTQLPAQDQLPGGKWQAGKNYQPIVPAQPTSAPAGKVEVVEVFWYGCSHCYALDPFLENWQKSGKPGFVEFVRVPVMWGPAHKAHARLFYTLEALGREKDLHAKVFDTIQKGGNALLGNDDAATAAVQAKWAAAQGISEGEFMRTYNSFGVNSSLQRAEQLTRRYNVLGVPLMVVNGKYNTDVAMAGGHTQLISLLNDLASSEKRR
jgi:thiol:disulfide interchange protein DsbA